MERKYKRILVKLSGEAFAGSRDNGIDPGFTQEVAAEIAQVVKEGTQVGVVIGGGNFFRGAQAVENGLTRVTADYIGMLATVMNALALSESLEQTQHIETRVQSAIEMPGIAEPYIRRRAIRHMEKGRVVIFAAGLGHPYITTDMAGAMRALEMKSDAFFKATKVDGVYTDDPVTNTEATKFEQLSYMEAIGNEQIKVMDLSAITLCSENKLPIIVFNLREHGNLRKAVNGEHIGTIIQ